MKFKFAGEVGFDVATVVITDPTKVLTKSKEQIDSQEEVNRHLWDRTWEEEKNRNPGVVVPNYDASRHGYTYKELDQNQLFDQLDRTSANVLTFKAPTTIKKAEIDRTDKWVDAGVAIRLRSDGSCEVHVLEGGDGEVVAALVIFDRERLPKALKDMVSTELPS